MIDFSKVKAVTIPEGSVKRIKCGSTVIWEKGPAYTDLVPTAMATDGTILDGIGYRRGVSWSSDQLVTSNTAFTAIGLIPIDGTVAHDIYVYGLNFSGTTYNRMPLFNANRSNLTQSNGLKDGFNGTYVTVTKLGTNYFKITNKIWSSNPKYFAISGVTISGVVPIVTIDEPIF